MGTTNDDVKQALLDLLSEESIQVLQVAYIYAKNYVMYGEDITKEWTTAVQQASIIEQVRQKAWVEAYDSFKKEYEDRLKADLAAMLTEIQLELDEMKITKVRSAGFAPYSKDPFRRGVNCSKEIIQQKIDSLKGVKE